MMKKKNLFINDSEESDAEQNFKTNKDYAKSFNKLRSKELLKKYKNDSESESSSDDSSSDEDTINPKFDEAFFKTLSSIKKKDSKIYNANEHFFQEFDGVPNKGSDKKSEKALTVKDYERKILLEKGGIYEEDDEKSMERPHSPTYNEEQSNLKNEFKKILHDNTESDDEEWGGIFKRRDKSREEEKQEEEQYTKWLAGEEGNIGTKAEELKPLKDYWTNPKLSKDETFLRDYILNNGYTKHNANQVPTYDDIVGNDVDPDFSDDEAELEKQAEFEQKFNFRFEEPDAEFIKTYPRTIENSVRRTDTKRAEKRQEIKDRKLKEKQQKLKDLEMISELRKKEIEEKIMKLKQVSGNDDIPFDDADLDGDFDPEEYDRKMQKVFDNEYYQIDEGETKPECPLDIEDLQVEDWDNFDPKEYNDAPADGPHCEDEEFNMDCDYQEEDKKKSLQEELIENTRDRRKRRKRQSKFVEMLQRDKPVFDAKDEKTYGEYLDEYYNLDYEDIIGDTPCRFKYTETVPNDFGLSIEEILMSKNKELNQWASLKKATQIRPAHVEKNEVTMFQMKGKNEALKRKILRSLYEEPSDDENSDDNKLKISQSKKKSETAVSTETSSVHIVENFKMIRQDDEELDKDNIIISQSKKKSETAVSTETSSVQMVENFKMIRQDDEELDEEKTVVKNQKDLPVKEEEKEVAVIKPNLKSKKRKISDAPEVIHEVKKIKTDRITVKKAGPLNKSPLLKKQEKIIIAGDKMKKLKLKKQSKNANAKKQAIVVPPKSTKLFAKKQTKLLPQKQSMKLVPSKKHQTAVNKNAVKHSGTTNVAKLSDQRLEAFGVNPKKYHKKLKYGVNAKAPEQQQSHSLSKKKNDKTKETPKKVGNLKNNKKLSKKQINFKSKLKQFMATNNSSSN